MYIEPNSIIRLLTRVSLDPNYSYTIYFNSVAEQTNYFMSKQKYYLSGYSYQRINRGYARVGIKAEDLYDCNYMMFQNTAFGNKWFYAFITSVEYVNDECSEIRFEIDVMQTWHFDYELGDCFVEREHTQTDRIGDNIVPENLAVGEYVMNDYKPIISMSDMCVIIAVVDVDNGTTSGTLYDGIYGSAELYAYDSTDVTSINAKVGEYAQKPEAIIGMYMLPKILLGDTIPSGNKLSYGARAVATTVTLEAVSSGKDLDGYVPVNNKLYTYPYCFYHIDNASGSELSLRYEFFQNLTPVVEISGTVTQPVNVVLRPCSYKGVANYDSLGGYTTLNTESIQLNNYPMCSWNIDAYQAWVAQNSVPLVLDSITSVAQTAVASQQYVYPSRMQESTAIGNISSILSQAYKASIAADISKGNLNNGGPNTANHKQQFYGGRCSVSGQYMLMIDDYFNMYGYAMKRIKQPARNVRPYWTYTKTIGCDIINAQVPADDLKKIASIYDNGITFWNGPDNVGNYSLDNRPEIR